MKKPEKYWTYKGGDIPEVSDLPPGTFKGDEKAWQQLSPGMRREIYRYAMKKKEQLKDNPRRKAPRLNARSAKRHTRKANTPKRKRQWSKVYGSAAKRGASEASAIRQASAAVKKTVLRKNPRMPSNIEKSPFRKGEYTGYGAYGVYHIKKTADGWQATTTGSGMKTPPPRQALHFRAPTLAKLSDMLASTKYELLDRNPTFGKRRVHASRHKQRTAILETIRVKGGKVSIWFWNGHALENKETHAFIFPNSRAARTKAKEIRNRMPAGFKVLRVREL